MRVHLMSPETDFDPAVPEGTFADDVVQDLQLDYLWDAMAADDPFLRRVVRAATLQMLTDPRIIVYRQQARSDALHNRDIVSELYRIAVAAVNVRKGMYTFTLPNHPRRELEYAVTLLDALADHLDSVRRLVPQIKQRFESPAFLELAMRISTELDDEYMERLRGMLRNLNFSAGMLMSASVGAGGTVTGQILRQPADSRRNLFNRVGLKRPQFSFVLPERDEAGADALSELQERSVNEVANAASQALDHVQSFFATLRIELGFYMACNNLVDTLNALNCPLCEPDPSAEASTSTTGLYDPCLALRMGNAPVSNVVELGTSRLLVITGANRGGKSTLLRALGTAQLMMQAGMPVAAERFGAVLVGALFTHWAKEEDTGLVHGKLDEELERMERIVAAIAPGDLLLCNESFASTNEAEGSQILLDITQALVTNFAQVRSVTHLYDFAISAINNLDLRAVSLRAPRESTGQRSYHLTPGEPLETSFGLDLYDQAFGTSYAESALSVDP